MMSHHPFDLLLFSTDPSFVKRAVAAGIDGVIVDWENIGKRERQRHADTQINHDTVADLRRVRASTDALVICRINSYGETTASEVEQAVAAGADEILLPMVRTVSEVEGVLALAAGRCGVGILIETLEAVQRAAELSRLPLTRIYVGLNDLAIERKSPSIFSAVADRIVERVSRTVTVPFGFGGLTLPDCGFPIPCRLLIIEMMRLDCRFGFLRRSFHRDIKGRRLAVEIPRLRAALQQARQRPPEVIARDRRELEKMIVSRPERPQ